MKRIFWMSALFAAVFSFVSCGDDDKDNELDSAPSTEDGTSSSLTSYKGTITVTYMGEEVVTEGIQSTCKTNDSKTLTISLIGVKFVPQMPVTITLEIPEVPYEEKDGEIIFQAEKIIPTMGGNPVEQYAANNLAGRISEDGIMSYSLTFGTYPTSYTGKLESK